MTSWPISQLAQTPPVPEISRQMILALGTRSQVTVPMLRDGEPIGAITLGCAASPARSTTTQVALLQTFADQAVIAIENVRLFNETKEALERQTASNDILKVMAASPADVQPVFDAIVADAQRLTGATTCHVHRVDGEWLQLAAFSASDEGSAAALRRMFPLRSPTSTPRRSCARASRDWWPTPKSTSASTPASGPRCARAACVPRRSCR